MPQVYDKTDFGAGSSRQWNFGKYSPEIVSIVLGTSDLSNGNGQTPRAPFDSARFVNNYISFAQFVKSNTRLHKLFY
ncbi:MAG: hypothetical protein J7502_16555 [Flavisolibacter sp.]|nr:hypothetical protein [Flavisolibacter sp.]